MKFITTMKLCIPAALLAAASVNASATTCSSSGQSLQSLVALGSAGCTIGDLTFSNFFFNYTSGHVTGSDSNPSTPAATDVMLEFNEFNDGITADTFGTTGSPERPVYQVVTDYSGIPQDVTVNAFQNEHAFVSYVVTDNTTGTTIEEVDDAIAGTLTPPATNNLSDKTICVGGGFVIDSNAPTSTCSTSNAYEAVDETSGGLALPASTGLASDSSINYSVANGGKFDGTYANGAPLIGIYDQVDLVGGTSSPDGTTTLEAVENDFVVGSATAGAPEPSTIVLLGGALMAFGAHRRRKRT